MRDLSRADRVIDAVAAVGEEARLNGLSFELSDPDGAEAGARRAFKGRRGPRPRQYAELAGRALGRLDDKRGTSSRDSRAHEGRPQPDWIGLGHRLAVGTDELG